MSFLLMILTVLSSFSLCFGEAVRLIESEDAICFSERLESEVPLRIVSPVKVSIGLEGMVVAPSIILEAPEIVCEGKLVAPASEIVCLGKRVVIGKEGTLDVSADEAGDGGVIQVLGEVETVFLGKAFACGGSRAGNGGMIEISGSRELRYRGVVDLTAPFGKTGLLFLDPKNVVVERGGLGDPLGNTFGNDPGETATIDGDALSLALASAHVLIQANNDITINDFIIGDVAGHGLTLQAGRSIVLERSSYIQLNQGDFSVRINDDNALVGHRDLGLPSFIMSPKALVLTQGGNVSVNVGSFGGDQEGVIELSGAILDGGGGDVVIRGFGHRDGSNGVHGVLLKGGSLIQTTGSGEIDVRGVGGTGALNNSGICLLGSNDQISSKSGMITLHGQGGGTLGGGGNKGILISGSVTSLDGALSLTGTAGLGISNNEGISLSMGSLSTEGNIDLVGTGAGMGDLNFGVHLGSGSSIAAQGGSALNLNGTAGNGVSYNYGVNIAGGKITADAGSVVITGHGKGQGDYNDGVHFESSGQVKSLSLAPVTIDGDCVQGVKGNIGISISGLLSGVEAVDGAITLTGTGNGKGELNQGIRIEAGQIISTGTGGGAAAITLTGTGGGGTNYNNGITVVGTSAKITSVDGDILLDGTSSGVGTGNEGVELSYPQNVYTTGGVLMIDSH